MWFYVTGGTLHPRGLDGGRPVLRHPSDTHHGRDVLEQFTSRRLVLIILHDVVLLEVAHVVVVVDLRYDDTGVRHTLYSHSVTGVCLLLAPGRALRRPGPGRYTPHSTGSAGLTHTNTGRQPHDCPIRSQGGYCNMFHAR